MSTTTIARTVIGAVPTTQVIVEEAALQKWCNYTFTQGADFPPERVNNIFMMYMTYEPVGL